jgi:hypothetical protein
MSLLTSLRTKCYGPAGVGSHKPGLHHPHLHGVHDLFTDEDGADDDYGGAGFQTVLFHQDFQRRFDGVSQVDEVEWGRDEKTEMDLPSSVRAAIFILN